METDQQHHGGSSALQREEEDQKSLRQRIKELEEQLENKSSALKAKEEELRSFKDRVAGEVSLSMKTGTTISMNNPVSKTRLKEMYENLRYSWPKTKQELKQDKETPEGTKKVIQGQFKTAAEDMERKKMLLDEVFGLDKKESGTPEKVKQYRQLTTENLQLALYSKKYDGLKKLGSAGCFSGREGEKPPDATQYLASECYWLGCLMALNNPPLHPDWDNHPPSMDLWDVWPRNLIYVSEAGKV